MDMKPAQLTPAETEAVQSLRENVKDLLQPDYDTDFNLLRWLQDSDFNLSKATAKLRRSLRTRNIAGFKRSQDPYEDREPYFAHNYPYGRLGSVGIPGDNYVLNIACFGRYDCVAMHRSMQQTLTARGYLKDCEEELAAINDMEEKTGEQWSQLLLIDLQDMVMDKYVLTGPFIHLVRYVFDNFPHMIRKAVVINAPAFFYYFWKIIGPLLPLHGVKVEFLSSKWRDEIKEHIHPDALPVYWGGNLVDKNNDPKCAQWIRIPGGPVPPDQYWKPSEKDLEISKELEKLTVHAGKAEFVTIHIESAGTELSWYFVAHSWFTFGLYFTEREDEQAVESMELANFQFPVMDSTHVPEKGSIVCEKPGFYKFRFGNENRFRKLHIEFKIWHH